MTVTTIETSTSFATEKVAAAHIRADKGLLVADSHWMRDWTQHVQKDLILASDEAAADAYGIYKHKSAVVMRDMTPGVGLQRRQIDTFIPGWGEGYRAVGGGIHGGSVPMWRPGRFGVAYAEVLLGCLMSTPNSRAAQKSRDNALEDLEELECDAVEDGRQPPSPIAEASARALIETLARELPRNYSVSLVERGDVAVYSSGGRGWRVSVYCRANGGASLYVIRPDDKACASHYRSAKALPVKLVIDALKDMPM